MPPVAIARPLWSAALRSLRDVTRLAMTALVLTLSLGGAAAGTPATAPQTQPTIVVTRASDPRPAPRPVAVDRPEAADRPHHWPATDPTAEDATTPAAVAVRVAAPATAPLRGPLGVRGPPRA